MWFFNACSAAYCAVKIVTYVSEGNALMTKIMAVLLVLNMAFVVRGI